MTLPVFFTDTGSIIKNENSSILELRYTMIVKVPSSNTYIKATGHMSSLEEVAPTIYADRVVILHNPIETGDKHMLGTRPIL
jgi:hypothetical protein